MGGMGVKIHEFSALYARKWSVTLSSRFIHGEGAPNTIDMTNIFHHHYYYDYC
jgi:hypothetical protein